MWFVVFRVQHDREDCIGCGACVAVCPEYWEMASDGKSKLKGTKKNVLEVSALGKLLDSAHVCPVKVIHVTDLSTGKKIV